MVRQHPLLDDFLIKRVYKKLSEFNGIEELYFLLADGSVIIVSCCYEKTPAYLWAPGLETKVGRFGGFCKSNDGGILVGIKSKGENKWDCECIDCGLKTVISDSDLDGICSKGLEMIEEENKF